MPDYGGDGAAAHPNNSVWLSLWRSGAGIYCIMPGYLGSNILPERPLIVGHLLTQARLCKCKLEKTSAQIILSSYHWVHKYGNCPNSSLVEVRLDSIISLRLLIYTYLILCDNFEHCIFVQDQGSRTPSEEHPLSFYTVQAEFTLFTESKIYIYFINIMFRSLHLIRLDYTTTWLHI